MKRDVVEIVRQYGKGPLRAFDMYNNEVHHVAWIDDEAGTYGQYVIDNDGRPRLDPNSPGKPWTIVQLGRLRLEPIRG